MKKKFSTFGKSLTKTEQKNIKGGNICSGYDGPIIIRTCEEFFNIPPQFQACVLVLENCFLYQ